MAPLPCSPVSNSTASAQSTQPSEEDSDDSLTTPRPGPSDPAQRTAANLSKASVPTFSTSPDSRRVIGSLAEPLPGDGTIPRHSSVEGRPRDPYTYGLATNPNFSPQNTRNGAEALPGLSERPASVSFTSQTSFAKPERQGSYSMSGRRSSQNVSPNGEPQARRSGETDSSADESTAIIRRMQPGRAKPDNYGAIAGDDDDVTRDQGGEYDGSIEEPDGPRKRRTNQSKSKGVRHANENASIPRRNTEGSLATEPESGGESWFKRLAEKYGSVELENKGSTARDHLALERTFLAWIRTSLSFASIGIAVTQLFRLNKSLPNNNSDAEASLSATDSSYTSLTDTTNLGQVGKPLGAAFIGISILILLLGFHRYFESQHYVIRGKFPSSRGSIIIVTFVACALIVASLVVVVTVSPAAVEKK